MKRKTLLYVHKKVAKGRTYYYFDLGRDESGNRVLKRLPDVRSHKFAAAYTAAQGQRTKQETGQSAKNFDWLVRVYEKSPEFRSKAENSQRLYTRHLAYVNENFRSKTGRSWPLAIITAEQVVALRDKYAETPGTANAILKALGALFHWATRPGRGYVKQNIATGIELLEMGEHLSWPKPLVAEALNDPEIRLPVALLYFLGQRIGDTVKLGRGNMANGAIRLTQEKTGKTLTVPIHSRLAEILEADVPRDQLVFMLGDRGTPVTESGLRQRMQKWARARGHHIVPHGLRKNAVNALIEAGCSTAEVAAITGQSLQMVEHYGKERDQAELGRSAILKFEARNKG